MIYVPLDAFIALSALKMRKLRIHQPEKILANCLFNIGSDHLIKFLELFLNSPKNINDFRRTKFIFHGASPFA
jgi:hypothetical protein